MQNPPLEAELDNNVVERLSGKGLVVFLDSVKYWEPPPVAESVTAVRIRQIMEYVKRNTTQNAVEMSFE